MNLNGSVATMTSLVKMAVNRIFKIKDVFNNKHKFNINEGLFGDSLILLDKPTPEGI